MGPCLFCNVMWVKYTTFWSPGSITELGRRFGERRRPKWWWNEEEERRLSWVWPAPQSVGLWEDVKGIRDWMRRGGSGDRKERGKVESRDAFSLRLVFPNFPKRGLHASKINSNVGPHSIAPIPVIETYRNIWKFEQVQKVSPSPCLQALRKRMFLSIAASRNELDLLLSDLIKH